MVRWLLLSLTFWSAIGCSRTGSGNSTSIVIQVPEAANGLNKTGGVGAMAAMPTDRKVCYGVNVTGPGIGGAGAGQCSFATGVVGGFVEPGAVVQVEVPKGSSRKVQLYAFLQQVGQNLPCPQFSRVLPGDKLASTYLVGTAENINLISDEVAVDITANFPGLGNNVAVANSYPASCTSGAAPGQLPGFHISSSAGVATGTGVNLKARIGTLPGSQVLTGTGIRLKVK